MVACRVCGDKKLKKENRIHETNKQYICKKCYEKEQEEFEKMYDNCKHERGTVQDVISGAHGKILC